MGKSNVLSKDVAQGLPPDVPVGDRNLYYEDSRARSIVKALSWRLTALIVTSIVVWVVTGSMEFAAAVAAADASLKIVPLLLSRADMEPVQVWTSNPEK